MSPENLHELETVKHSSLLTQELVHLVLRQSVRMEHANTNSLRTSARALFATKASAIPNSIPVP